MKQILGFIIIALLAILITYCAITFPNATGVVLFGILIFLVLWLFLILIFD